MICLLLQSNNDEVGKYPTKRCLVIYKNYIPSLKIIKVFGELTLALLQRTLLK